MAATDRGAATILHLPPDAIDPINETFTEYRRLFESRRQVVASLQRTQNAVREAELQDVESHAKALRNGGQDPGTPATDKAKAEVQRLTREKDAHDAALRHAEDDVVRAIREHSDAWQEAIKTEREKAEEEFLAALDNAAAALARLDEHDHKTGFLRRFHANGNVSYKTPRFEHRDPTLLAQLRKGAASPFRNE